MTTTPNQPLESRIVGCLDVYIVTDAQSWHGGTQAGDRYITKFTGSDWDAVFRDVFNCPEPEPYIDGENMENYLRREQIRFQQSVPEYPMLGRIWDM